MKIKICYSLPLLLLISCGGSDSEMPPAPPVIATPEATTLVFPEDDTECNISEIISDTQSTVTFQWNASENTDDYQINITNLNSGAGIIMETEALELPVTIERGTPYEWFVTSRAEGTNETARSDTFRFFNEGPGIENYVPFPAEAINPQRGANLFATTTSVDLQWVTSDIDGDELAYEVFFGTQEIPTNLVSTTSETNFTVAVASGDTYFWSVRTTDVHGNSSDSEIFEFKIR